MTQLSPQGLQFSSARIRLNPYVGYSRVGAYLHEQNFTWGKSRGGGGGLLEGGG